MLPTTQVPDEINWATEDWLNGHRASGFYPNGWAVSAIKSIEAQFYNKTGSVYSLTLFEEKLKRECNMWKNMWVSNFLNNVCFRQLHRKVVKIYSLCHIAT